MSRLSEIHTSLSRAAVDPEAWQGVTDTIAASFPGARSAMMGYDVTMERSIPAVYTGYDPAFVDSYNALFGDRNPYLPGWTSLPAGRIAHSMAVLPEEEVLRTEYWADWLRPQGDLRNAVATVLTRDPGRTFLFNCQIELKAAPRVTRPVARTMRDLVPLLCHTLEINRMMLGLRLDAVLLRQGVEPARAATLLLSEQGSILFANARAAVLLAEGRVLRHDLRGRLELPPAGAMVRLEGALRRMTRPADLTFQLGQGPEATEMRLMPVTAETVAELELPLVLQAPPPALLVVARAAPLPCDETAPLRERLRLTQAEAEVALALAEGATLAEIAERRGVSLLTVRDQVRSAMGKAEVHRQSGLVRAVTELRRPG
ncbi:helix-turn-helix transcriptional regulator [Rubellimicrobium roseum]|uniref:HTH luxR-type domain-containing protein n=1 Tax=Rubellimicrobium roseum TaxID=687525 RepID=A0A5C4N9J6_9RHOB|nr:LuxR C-terminal-related transcriptional regulator [Rubellimicrobium roseum]TNC60462.1 hypothetical protein FHG71_22060 [Rubellimicrobium roseum]